MPDPNTDQRPVPGRPLEARPWGMDEPTFCMLLHLSPLAGYAVPVAGFVLPLVMWLTQKDESPTIDAHGRVVVNWMISSLIYFVVSAVLMLVLIGFLTLFATFLCGVIFMVVGAVKASKHEVWNYPLSIPFLGRPYAGSHDFDPAALPEEGF